MERFGHSFIRSTWIVCSLDIISHAVICVHDTMITNMHNLLRGSQAK